MTLRLRLYVAGDAPNSLAARENLRVLLEQSGHASAEVEVVDIFVQPELAIEDGVIVTPTLVRLAPTPSRRVVGNLGDRALALRALGLAS